MSRLILLALVFVTSCDANQNPPDLRGVWQIVEGSERNLEPFHLLRRHSSPLHYASDKTQIYIHPDRIEQPIVEPRRVSRVADKFMFHQATNDSILLEKDSVEYRYDFELKGDRLCFNAGKTCFERIGDLPEPLDSTIFTISFRDEFSPPYHFQLNYFYRQDSISQHLKIKGISELIPTKLSSEECEYLMALLARIPAEQLDRIYNNAVSDCQEVSLDFHTADHYYRGIETCGTGYETPFPVRAVIHNVWHFTFPTMRAAVNEYEDRTAPPQE